MGKIEDAINKLELTSETLYGVDLPNRGSQKNGETIHFNPKNGGKTQ